MLNADPLPVLCNILPITGIVRVTLLTITIEQETMRNTGDAQCAVYGQDICKSSPCLLLLLMWI